MKQYIVNSEKVDLLNQNWDILVILDACRYDLFREVYSEFFKIGSLKKAISPATWTIEWLNKIFNDKYLEDIIYISSNVFVNSKKEISYNSKGDFRSFHGKKHFFKVIDVWDFGWNVNLGTVHPREINRYFMKYYLKYPKKRYILHYMQPHPPYITTSNQKIKTLKNKKPSKLRKIAQKFLTEEIGWKIKNIIGYRPESIQEIIYRKNGWDGIKEVYKNEIRLALKFVQMLTDALSANFLITSDHGERLGEYLFRERHGGRRDKEVIEVPWYEVY